jgi:hypothetical protein
MEYITAIAEGRPLPSYSWDDINGKNDSRAARIPPSARPTSSRSSRGRGLRRRIPPQYERRSADRTGELALAGRATVNTQALIEGGVLIDHVKGHLASIRAAG